MSRLVGPQRDRQLSGGSVTHAVSRVDRTCEGCRRRIPAGVRHVVNTATPAYAEELGYGRHWLTMRTCGESPRACYPEEVSRG